MIDAADVPVSDAAREMAKTNGSVPLDHALYDGEDFELILCLSETEFEKIKPVSYTHLTLPTIYSV